MFFFIRFFRKCFSKIKYLVLAKYGASLIMFMPFKEYNFNTLVTLPCTLIFMAENVLLKLDGQVATPVYNNISKVNHHKPLAYEEGTPSFAAHLR